jgi:hypothetical protein
MATLEEYGKKILTKEIKNKRTMGYFKNYEGFNVDIFNKIIIEINLFNLNDVTYFVKKMVDNIDNEMSWHIDDAILMDVTEEEIYNNIKISENKQLVYHNQIPIYTLIINENNYNDDFTGGELIFVDDYKYIPKQGSYILFDSCEVYKTNKITSGMKKSILIKFYK